jgi:uncharacterized RDD family membrane protein YckC
MGTASRAGAGTRITALALDFVLFAILYLAIYAASVLALRDSANAEHLLSFFPAVFFALLFVYFTLMDSFLGGTVGKLLLRIAVTDKNLGRISLHLSAARVAAFFLFGGFFGVDFIFYLLSHERQCLHDYVTSTYVMNVAKGRTFP